MKIVILIFIIVCGDGVYLDIEPAYIPVKFTINSDLTWSVSSKSVVNIPFGFCNFKLGYQISGDMMEPFCLYVKLDNQMKKYNIDKDFEIQFSDESKIIKIERILYANKSVLIELSKIKSGEKNTDEQAHELELLPVNYSDVGHFNNQSYVVTVSMMKNRIISYITLKNDEKIQKIKLKFNIPISRVGDLIFQSEIFDVHGNKLIYEVYCNTERGKLKSRFLQRG